MTSERIIRLKALGLTLLVHGVVIASLLLFGFVQPEEEPPIIVDAALVEIAKLGDILPDPKKLVRIEASKTAETEPEKIESLSRRVVEKKKPKTKKKPKKKPEKKKKPKKKPERKKKPKKKLSELSNMLDDELDDDRADDEDSRIGYRGGDARGRSHDPNALEKSYLFELSAALRPHLKVPEVISARERIGLQTKVFFKISRNGKVVGKPRIINGSGNRLFDNAALSAINHFATGRPGNLPLPKDSKLRKKILQTGIKTNMRPSR